MASSPVRLRYASFIDFSRRAIHSRFFSRAACSRARASSLFIFFFSIALWFNCLSLCKNKVLFHCRGISPSILFHCRGKIFRFLFHCRGISDELYPNSSNLSTIDNPLSVLCLQRLRPLFAALMQTMCSVTAKALQRHCHTFAASLQWVCSGTAKEVQEVCSVETLIHKRL